MRYLYFAFMLFGTTSAYSQTWFPDGKTWDYNVSAAFDLSNYGIHTLTVQPGDTTILGRKCKKISWKGITYTKHPSYFYEDLSKVYVYNPYDNKFDLLYDFDLKVGDSLNSISLKCVVDKIGRITVNNKEYKWQLMKISGHFNQKYTSYFIEGIGPCPDLSPDGFKYTCGYLNFHDACLGFIDGWNYIFKCVTDSNGSYPTHNCNITSVDNTQEKNVVIQPNPATDYIDVVSSYEIESIEVYNLNGAKIATIHQSLSITTSSWPNGVYVLKLATKNNGIIHKKVVKL